MLGGAIRGAVLVTLMTFQSTAAEAEQVAVRDEQPCSPDSPCNLTGANRQKCYETLAVVESQLYKGVKEKTLDEEQIDDLNLLLDEADLYCEKAKYEESRAKMEAAIAILRGSPTEKVD
jgi:hypothetical protein